MAMDLDVRSNALGVDVGVDGDDLLTGSVS
jgi:hypothetical protein